MRVILMLLVVLMSVASFAETYNDLLVNFNDQVALFEESPTEESFNSAKDIAEQLMEIRSNDPRGYIGLENLYITASGSIFEELEGYEKGLQVLDQYDQVEGEKYDISEFRQRLISMIESQKKYERVQERHVRLAEDRQQPPAVLRSQELILQYGREENLNGLDEAVAVLHDALKNDPANYKLYLALTRVYERKRDYIRAYAAWELTMHFGGKESFLVQGQTGRLYREAIKYQEKHSVSDENPGSDFSLYFLWLQRETLWEGLTEKGRADTERLQKKINEMLEKAREQQKHPEVEDVRP